MTSGVGFLLFLGLTLALLGTVVWTGYNARRRVHLTFVACAVTSLGVTIFFAERLGHQYDLQAAGWIYPVHLFIAKACTVAYVLPVATGLLTIKNQSNLRLHRVAAFSVLGLTVLTAVTGTWMVFVSERIEVTEAEAEAWPGHEVRAGESGASNPQ